MADPFTLEEAVDQEKDPQSFTLEEATQPDLGVSGTLRSGALGAGAGFLERAGHRIAKAVCALSEFLPVGAMAPGYAYVPPDLQAEQKRRASRTPAQLSKDISQNPLYQAGDIRSEEHRVGK